MQHISAAGKADLTCLERAHGICTVKAGRRLTFPILGIAHYPNDFSRIVLLIIDIAKYQEIVVFTDIDAAKAIGLQLHGTLPAGQ